MKIVLSLLLSLILSGSAFAQSSEGFFTIQNFSAGEKTHVSEYLVKDGEAVSAQNVRVNDHYGEIAKRSKRLNLSMCTAAPVKSLYRYYRSNDTEYTVSTASTNIYSSSNAGACTTLYASGTDGKRWSFVTYKDILIGMNGTNNAKKWDGSTTASSDTLGTDGARTAGDLVADLGAPFAEQNTGSNLDASSWYQYRVAYYNGSYYTYSTARSNPLLTGSTVRDISLTDIPLGPDGTTARYIYRTLGAASRAAVIADTTFYLVATLSNNTATTANDAMVDTTADDDAAPTWATVAAGYDATPPKSKYALINQERLFVANDPSGVDNGKSTVYYSPVFKPDYFYVATDYELVRPDDGDEITFIKNLLGTLTVGKTRTISKIYTEGAVTNWSVSDPYSFIGCVAPWSAVNGISGIIYLGRYGIYNFGGQSSELISDVVTDKIRDILETNQDEVAGIYHDNSYYMAYTSLNSGAANNDKVLVFDVTRNAYVEDTYHVDSFAAYDSGEDAGTLFTGSSEVDGSIYAHSDSFQKLTYRYLSQLQGGTSDSVFVGGDEEDPVITLGDNLTWADSGATTWDASGSATWLFDDQTGFWYSPIVQVNAANYDKLTWNESLGEGGNITFAIRSGATSAATSAAAFSSEYSTPSGSDVSGLTANVFVQLRASLSTTSWVVSPELFVSDSFMMKLSYTKSGSGAEPSYLSLWQGGITNMGTESPKRVKEIQVFYTGDSGTLTLSYESEKGTVRTFDIDLSIDPASSATDAYFGTNEDKIFTFIPDFSDQPVGRNWRFKVSENGTERWKVQRIVARIEILPYTALTGDL